MYGDSRLRIRWREHLQLRVSEPVADDGNFLFDEDQEAEQENTHDMDVCAPAPIQDVASPLGAKDGGCLSRSPSSIMFFDNFSC